MPPETVSVWDTLAEPFPPEAVKERQGPKQHQGACEKQYGQCKSQHKMLSYVDARDVEARLDDAVTPAGWDFTADLVGTGPVVRGTLVLFVGDRAVTRQDYGYPNGDDDAEPIKSAVSDAIKRCAVQFGVGRHLYTDNKARRPRSQEARQPAQNAPQRPRQAEAPRDTSPRPQAAPAASGPGMSVRDAMAAVEGLDKKLVSATAKEIAGTWSFREMTDQQRAAVVAAVTRSAGEGGAAVPSAATSPAPDDDGMWAGMDAA